MDRIEIDPKYKWDLTKIYASDEAFGEDMKKAETLIKAFSAKEDVMCKSAEGLYGTLSAMTEIGDLINKLWTFAFLNFAIDNSDNSAQARVARVRSLAASADEVSWFVSPYLIRLDEATVEAWYTELPLLEKYRRTIEQGLREKPYTLSDECEKLVSKMSDCLGSHDNIRGIFANSDLQFGKIRDENGKYMQLTDTNFVPTLMKGDRGIRRAAFNCLYKTYGQFGNTFATMYSSYVKERCTFAKIRGFKSSLEASTFRDEVTPKIYNSLIKHKTAEIP